MALAFVFNFIVFASKYPGGEEAPFSSILSLICFIDDSRTTPLFDVPSVTFDGVLGMEA